VAVRRRLHFVSDDTPGIRRVGGKRFRYVNAMSGREITDGSTLDRIRTIAVPPAWTDVWISPDPRGHLQATGRDAKGRKQYRYHTEFRAERESTKFDELTAFGDALGGLRARVAADLAKGASGEDRASRLPRDRVLAAVVRLLQETYIRVGNEEYATKNASYGLTTLRSRHVRTGDGSVRFVFTGKGGQRHDVTIGDRRVLPMIKRLQDLPGQALFQYADDDGELRQVRSNDVNDYLRDTTGLDVTAKTFRTWGATLLAGAGLAAVEQVEEKDLRQEELKAAVAVVAEQLGNTPTVCRRSYIHPTIIDGHLEGWLASRWAESSGEASGNAGRGLIAEERKLLAVLREPGAREVAA
jgi:DNA topoisomerase-1